MAIKVTLIKDLKSGDPTIFQLLNTFVFGDKVVEKYDDNKVYNTGDIITVINEITGKTEVLQCTEDNVTGAYNPILWEKSSVADVAGSGGSKMISFSDTKPEDKTNILWFRPQNKRILDVPVSIIGN